MELNLVFLEQFSNEFKGKNYEIFKFLDKQSLQVINGTNLEINKELKPYNTYLCFVEYKNNKLKVTSVK